LQFISTHINAFYTHYADENGLSLSQTQQRVNSWDMQQWQQAIKELDMSDWPKEAKQRAKMYSVQAGFNKTGMIGAMIGLGIVALHNHYRNHIMSRIHHDGMAEIMHAQATIPNQARHVKMPAKPAKKLTSIVDQDSTKEQWSSNLWLDSDKLAHDVQDLVSKNLRHGIKPADMDTLLAQHNNPKQFKPNQSLADRLAQSKYNARRILVTESQRVNYHVDLTTMQMNNVKYVNWVNEPSSCDDCQGLADMSPYPINDCPRLPEDSHPNCRCHIEPATDVDASKVTGFYNLSF